MNRPADQAADPRPTRAQPEEPTASPTGASVPAPTPDRPASLDHEELTAYRQAAADLHDRLVGLDATRALPIAQAALSQPELAAVLDALPGASAGMVETLAAELARFRVGSPSSAQAPAALVRILLLSQVDMLWWRGEQPFTADADLRALVALARLRRAGTLRFRYRGQPHGLAGRARNYAMRRWLPDRSPHTAGLSQVVARPELIGLLNHVAGGFAAAAPSGTPPLWVTSMVRTVAQQQRLRELGYSAVLPSAHCVGLAADVEMRWFARWQADTVLADILLGYQRAGLVNVVDEGQAWHVCLSPAGRRQFHDEGI